MNLVYNGYPPEYTKPMEQELVHMGVTPLHSSQEVEKVLGDGKTTLLIVNSVCGCAAGNARPAIALAMKHAKKPENNVTVFAGVDREATQKAREYVKQYEPSSPSMFLFKDGKCVFALERKDIQGRDPHELATKLSAAFDAYC